jgi:hypothetical protein
LRSYTLDGDRGVLREGNVANGRHDHAESIPFL